MQARKKLKPGQKGAKKFQDQSGAKLVCVCDRCAAVRHWRYTTVELIAKEAPWTPPTRLAAETLVGLRVAFQEEDLQRRGKRDGGKWNPERRPWEVRCDQTVVLGLKDRIEEPKVPTIRCQRDA